MKYFILLFLILCSLIFTSCISHYFVDSTTRLQIENKTGYDFIEIAIISEDGLSIKPWIKDTIKNGEISKVYEEDWVGTFNARIIYTNFADNCECIGDLQITEYTIPQNFTTTSISSKDGLEKNCTCFDNGKNKGNFKINFSGGSVYLIFTKNEDGTLHFEEQ